MLRNLLIANFKGWKDTGFILMAPITLFFGANSSGKSSIGQFLMMLKQTVESSDRKAVFYPGGKNTAVQLGSFKDMIFGHNTKNPIIFRYTWDLKDNLKIDDPITNQKYKGNRLRFTAGASLENVDQNSFVLKSINYKLYDNDDFIFDIHMDCLIKNGIEYEISSKQYKLKQNKDKPLHLKAPYRFYGFPDEVNAHYQNAGFVQDINLAHEKLFQSIFYLGPLRTTADRLYSWTGNEPESVGYAGENSIAAILASKKRLIGLNKRKNYLFEELIAFQLKKMDLIKGFKVKPISKLREEYEVKIQTKGSKDWVDLPDVGFGISQVLPVLVQCFYAPHGSIIIMEQPEIHLHPSAQSALADVMIDVINSRENGIDRNIQLIIETHSEHFLRRLQRRIAEGVIPQEKVAAYFANITKSPAKLEPLEIDEYGNIRNWPENFFGDEMGDVIKHAEAALKMRKKKVNGKVKA